MLTVTAALALAVLPLEAVALTISTCGPLASVLVFSWPESPLYTEGVCSVHSRAPSIKNATLDMEEAAREGEAIQTTEPESVLPVVMLEETVKPAVGAGAGVGAGGAVTVTALAAEALPAELEASGKSRWLARNLALRAAWHALPHSHIWKVRVVSVLRMPPTQPFPLFWAVMRTTPLASVTCDAL